ncbi:MAG: ribose-phosphate diphosphokinase [Erysipelotrichaceae bacterium]|jgi:ribose-phosphate pyrophosphokinase|nr:ribose-phosphate diphosphokinase [Erysipelotrichaceae bacterium]
MLDKIIFTIDANKKTAKQLADDLKIPLGEVSITHFSDGEVICKTLSDVKNKYVYIIESTSKPAITRLFEILLLVDSIKRAGASKITLIMPYFGYSRQDTSYDNEPVSSEVVARMLNVSGIDELMSLDFHTKKIMNFFNVPIKNLSTTSLFKKYYEDIFNKRNIKNDNVLIISPDHGANDRAHHLCDALKANDVVILKKSRPRPNEAETLFIEGDIKDKVCIIIDDIIDTGTTIVNAVKILLDKGAKEVYVGATHAVFSTDAARRINEAGAIDIVVTNSIEKRLPPFVHILSIQSLLEALI